jgi:hypothetical protein
LTLILNLEALNASVEEPYDKNQMIDETASENVDYYAHQHENNSESGLIVADE